jgi:hypothetical protein
MDAIYSSIMSVLLKGQIQYSPERALQNQKEKGQRQKSFRQGPTLPQRPHGLPRRSMLAPMLQFRKKRKQATKKVRRWTARERVKLSKRLLSLFFKDRKRFHRALLGDQAACIPHTIEELVGHHCEEAKKKERSTSCMNWETLEEGIPFYSAFEEDQQLLTCLDPCEVGEVIMESNKHSCPGESGLSCGPFSWKTVIGF